MENRVINHQEFLFSPRDSELFYFPCGSISSCQESLDYTEDDIERHGTKGRSTDESVNNENIIIHYEQHSLTQNDEIYTEDDYIQEIDERDLEIPNNFQILEENYKKILAEYNLLKQKTSLSTYQNTGTLTDIKYIDMDQLIKSEEQKIYLEKELISANVEMQGLNSLIKSNKLELALAKEKNNYYETEFIKLKDIIDNIVDEDGTTKTSRNYINESNFFISLYDKLETIQHKIQTCLKPKKYLNDNDVIINELSSQIRQKNHRIQSLEFKIGKPSTFKSINKEVSDQIHTERSKNSSLAEIDTERLTYKDVLRDLREITSRATKALKNSSLSKRTINFNNSRTSSKNLSIDRFKDSSSYQKHEFYEKTKTRFY